MSKPEWLESISVLELKEGDTLVLKLKEVVSYETVSYINTELNDLMIKKGITPNVIVLDNADIEVLRKVN